jgi:hypothetical protein
MLDPDGPGTGRSSEPVDPEALSPGGERPAPGDAQLATDEAQLAADKWAAWWAAYAALGPPPAPPAPSSGSGPPPELSAPMKTYELPTARQVVGAGLTLAATSSRPIRRASLYIGLLALGAFGPAVVLLLLAIGRMLSDPTTAATMASDPTLILLEQPEIVGTLLLIYFLAIVGIVLLVAISIDAQAIAIALLGGIAAERPLRLWEAVVRARQTFWRLSAAAMVVGTISAVVSLIVVIPFLRPFDSNTGLTFIGSMIGTLAVTPFAFGATGIVLGNVGAIESLRRSIALFRARPPIAFVVTLFTLVTAAIQSFALDAGLDVVIRVADFLNLGLDQGVPGLVLPLVLVLAFVMAFGSLTFTVAAIVAAPQVAAFLGLTFYSGGLDRARAADGARRPSRFRWVSVPMSVTMVGVLAVAVLGVPSITAFEPRVGSPLLAYLRTAAAEHDWFVTAYGPPSVIEDPTADSGGTEPGFDIVAAEYGYLPDVPAWLKGLFDCGAPNVACGEGAPAPGPTTFANGAFVFVQRMAGPPGVVPAGSSGEWGPVVALPGFETAPAESSEPFPSASHAVITRVSGGTRFVTLLQFSSGQFRPIASKARSTWIGNDLITIVPVVGELSVDPKGWDAYARLSANGVGASVDSLRSTAGGPLQPFPGPPEYWLEAFGDVP